MYDEIIQRYGISLQNIPIIGDSLRDMQAAAKAGALPMLVLTGKGERTKARNSLPDGTKVFENLAGFVDSLIGKA